MTSALVAVAAIFFLGQALKGLFARVRVPEAVVFLVAGYVAGPVLGLFPEAEWNRFSIGITQLCLALIVYSAALAFNLKAAFQRELPAIALVLLGFGTALGVGCLFGSLYMSFPAAFYAGLGLAALGSGPVKSFISGNRAGTAVETLWRKEAIWAEGLAAAIGVVCIAGYDAQIFEPLAIFEAKGMWVAYSLAGGLGSGLLWAVLDRRVPSLTRQRFAADAWWILTFGAAAKLGHSGALAGLTLGLVQAQLAVGPRWLNLIFSDKPVTEERIPALADTWLVLTNLFWIRLGTQLKFSNTNLMLYCAMVVPAIWVARYLWVFVAVNPKRCSRWEAMSLFISSPRGLGALALAFMPIAFPNHPPGWVGSAIGLTVFFSLIFSTVGLAMVGVPDIRVRAHRLFGRYKEDFGVSEGKPEVPATRYEELTVVPAEVVAPKAAPPPKTIFAELASEPPPPSDGNEDAPEDLKEPTFTNIEIDITSLEDDPDDKRKAG